MRYISLILALTLSANAFGIGYIQTQDIKSQTDCTNSGVSLSNCLPKDTQIWMSTTTPPQTLDQAVITGALGGGGGGSLQWTEGANSPSPILSSVGNRVYLFQNSQAQILHTVVKVPHTYGGGTQVHLILSFYSPDSSGTALLQTVATLIRPGVDTYNSTTNQRTSTNSAVTLGAGTVNIPQTVSFDLTDSTGHINGVSLSADNIININLTRGTDTGASDLSTLVYSAEVTFH